eukprot:gene9696-biopygen9803
MDPLRHRVKLPHERFSSGISNAGDRVDRAAARDADTPADSERKEHVLPEHWSIITLDIADVADVDSYNRPMSPVCVVCAPILLCFAARAAPLLARAVAAGEPWEVAAQSALFAAAAGGGLPCLEFVLRAVLTGDAPLLNRA